MAKKDILKTGDLDLDLDFDFNSFNNDDLSGKIDDGLRKDNRSPVAKSFKGVVSGAKSTLVSPGFLRATLKKSLPREYGETLDVADTVKSRVGALYNDAVKEIKPEANRILRQVDRLVPAEKKRTKDFIEKIKKIVGAESDYRVRSKEEENEDVIQAKLAEIFTAQAEESANQRARDQAESKIQTQLDAMRHKDTFGLLNNINMSLTRLSSYNDRVTAAYQKKSLELQYRTYFVQKDLLENTKRYHEIFKVQNDAITKNTSLPEQAKVKFYERIKGLSHDRLITGVQNALFGNSKFLNKGIKNITESGRQRLSEFSSAFGTAAMTMEDLVDRREQIKEMNEMMREIGGEEVTRYDLIGGAAGGLLAGHLGGKLGKRFNKRFLNKDTRVGKFAHTVGASTRNLEGSLAGLKDSKFLADADTSTGALGGVKKGVVWAIDAFLNGASTGTGIESGRGLGGLRAAAQFDERSRLSLTDIIPGYLSRIYRELQITRTGNAKIALTDFDFRSNRFTDRNKLEASTIEFLKKQANVTEHKARLEEVYQELVGSEKLSPEAEQALKAHLSSMAFKASKYDSKTLKRTGQFEKHGEQVSKEIEAVFNRRYSETDTDIREKDANLSKRMRTLKESTNDISSEVQALYDAGHGRILENMGLVTVKPNGGVQFNSDLYEKLIGSERNVKSDINAKDTIHKIAPKTALSAINKTDIFNWFYKKNQGDNRPHTGPMAQDLKKNFGSEISPDGKSFDIVNMNGANMAAIKALHQDQETIKSQLGQENTIDIMRSIKTNTDIMVKRLSGIHAIGLSGLSLKGIDVKKWVERGQDQAANLKEFTLDSFEKIKDKTAPGRQRFSDILSGLGSKVGARGGYTGMIGNVALSASSLLMKTMEDFTGGLKTGSGKISEKTGQLKTNVSQFYKDHGPDIKDRLNGFYTKGMDLVSSVYDRASAITKDIIQTQLPAGYKQIAALALKGKETLINLLDQPIDIYVSGELSPRLSALMMRGRAYFDQMSGKLITRPSEITGPVVNKDGEVILSADDIKKGIHDKEGKGIKLPLAKLASGLVEFGLDTVSQVRARLSKVFSKLRSTGKAAADIGKSGLSRMTGQFGNIRPMIQLLTDIRTILDERLPGPRGNFAPVNSFAQMMPTAPESGMSQENPDTPRYQSQSSGSLLGAIGGLGRKGLGLLGRLPWGKGKGLKGAIGRGLSYFNKPTTPTGTLETTGAQPETTSTPKSRMGGLFGPLLSTVPIKKMNFTGQPKFNDRDASGRRDGSWEDRIDKEEQREAERRKQQKAPVSDDPRYKSNQNVIDVMLNKAKDAYGFIKEGLGSLGDLVSTVGGKGTKGVLGKLARGVGRFGKGGLMRGAGGAIARTVGGIAARTAGIAALGGMSGVASAATVAGGTLATSGMAALGTIGAIMASPVVIGGAAIGLGLFGLYKGAQYLLRNKASDLVKVRLRQYGLTEANKNQYHQIFELENYLIEDCVGYTQNRAYLSEKKLNPEKIFNIFEVSQDNPEKQQVFLTWFVQRFKPVFLTHLSALANVNNKVTLDKLESLSVDEKLRYLTAASFKNGPYNVTASPFEYDGRLEAGPSDVEAAINTAKATLEKLKPKETKKESGLIAKASINTLSEPMSKNTSVLSKLKTALIQASPVGMAMAAAKVSLSVGYKISRYLGFQTSALEAVRFRTYGLKDMERSKVSTLRNLEQTVSKYIKVVGPTDVRFDGDASTLLLDIGKEFGISSLTDKRALDWIEWFKTRFLPTYLSFIGYSNQITGKLEPEMIEMALKSGQKHEIATKIIGTTNVWILTTSPWEDYELNSDSTSTGENIQFLKNAAKQERLQEQRASKESPTTKSGRMASQVISRPPPPFKKITPSSSSDEVEPPTLAKGSNLKESSSLNAFTAGAMPLAKGSILEGKGADQYLKPQGGVDLANVHPDLLKNLRGMAEEYGTLTGKSIIITSAARSRNQQEILYRKDPSKAARPGSSLHEFGLAIDADSKTLDEIDQMGLMKKYGFTRPVGKEPWHMEPAGIQTNIGQAKEDPEFSRQAILASLGRGGGGYGTEGGSVKGKRNPYLAKSLYSAAGKEVTQRVETKETAVLPPALVTDRPTATTVKREPMRPVTEIQSPERSAEAGGVIPPGFASRTSGPRQTEAGVVTPEMKPRLDRRSVSGQIAVDNQYSQQRVFNNTQPGSYRRNPPGGSYSGGNVTEAIERAATQVGVDPNLLKTFAAIESSMNPNARARTSSATGLYQFVGNTWKSTVNKHGRRHQLDPNASPTDPYASSLMAGEFIKENTQALQGVRPNPNATDIYMAHFLGAGGARKFFNADPNALASEVLPKAAQANPSIFKGRTIAQVYALMGQKVQRSSSQFNIPINVGNGQLNVGMNRQGQPQVSMTGKSPTASKTPYPIGDLGYQTKTALPANRSSEGIGQSPINRNIDRSTGMPINRRITEPTIDVNQPSNLNYAVSEKALTSIDTTLQESLDIQTQMLTAMQQMLTQLSPEKLGEVMKMLGSSLTPAKESLGTKRGKEVADLTPAVNLKRGNI